MKLFTFKALGGLGEIGGNASLLTFGNESYLIDFGIYFPRSNQIGTSYLLPPYPLQTPKYTFITHGHEDHLGGVTHLVKRFPETTLYSSRFAKKLLESKLKYNSVDFDRINVLPNGPLELNDGWKVEPIEVTHSIPETTALVFTHFESKTAVLYITDFRVSSRSENYLTKLSSFADHYKNRILFADSTNVGRQSPGTTEVQVAQALFKHLSSPTERIFITLFSSNIDRLKAIISAAQMTDRKVICAGNSVSHYLSKAAEAGLTNYPETIFAEKHTPGKKSIIIVSGCQGDFKSALKRIAFGEDKQFLPNSSDLFIFSSKVIPGNEIDVNAIQNQLALKGTRVVDAYKDEQIHASGHPSWNELKIIYDHFLPQHVIPIHGESLHQRDHLDQVEAHFPNTKGHHLNCNDELAFLDNGKVDLIPTEEKVILTPVLASGLETDLFVVQERLKASRRGVLFVSLFDKTATHSTVGLPKGTDEWQEHFDDHVADYFKKRVTQDELQIALRKWWLRYTGEKPIVIIHKNR